MSARWSCISVNMYYGWVGVWLADKTTITHNIISAKDDRTKRVVARDVNIYAADIVEVAFLIYI